MTRLYTALALHCKSHEKLERALSKEGLPWRFATLVSGNHSHYANILQSGIADTLTLCDCRVFLFKLAVMMYIL